MKASKKYVKTKSCGYNYDTINDALNKLGLNATSFDARIEGSRSKSIYIEGGQLPIESKVISLNAGVWYENSKVVNYLESQGLLKRRTKNNANNANDGNKN